MGQTTAKICHMRSITFEPGGSLEEWNAVDEWSEQPAVGPNVAEATCRSCCVPADSRVEEVLVVHHEALQKINFLLRHDELQTCEAPGVPDCVTAIRRARIQKHLRHQELKALSGNDALEQAEDDEEDDPSDEVLPANGPQFESETHTFESFVSRLKNEGVPMIAVLPNGSKTIPTEVVTFRLMPTSAPLAFALVGETVKMRLLLSKLLCVVCADVPSAASDARQFPRGVAGGRVDAQKEIEPELRRIFQRCIPDEDGRISMDALLQVCEADSDAARRFGLLAPFFEADAVRDRLKLLVRKIGVGSACTWDEFQHFHTCCVSSDNLPLCSEASVSMLRAATPDRHDVAGVAKANRGNTSFVYLAILSDGGDGARVDVAAAEGALGDSAARGGGDFAHVAIHATTQASAGVTPPPEVCLGGSHDEDASARAVAGVVRDGAHLDATSDAMQKGANAGIIADGMHACAGARLDATASTVDRGLRTPKQLVFVNVQDAEDFTVWMKTFHAPQVLCLRTASLDARGNTKGMRGPKANSASKPLPPLGATPEPDPPD
eukprot:CAMPEP_0117500954 /NCGR_PEP_ID=MMETSP0784-20121206/23045_1 /TAXON_ID=39447 /ORGANISM="" /LENGTH=550 /DNA_ID=CAMNT_0005296185 /DNA_START=75 /DNA_END=1727 /DNA_ORIENTATION=-